MINKLKTIFKKCNKENEEQTNKQQTRFKPKKQNESLTQMLAEYCQKYPQI